ncbi:hypothetical protein J5N97_026777 [Dioscorea zingiberensis]|uniref:Uncharacterized protein n=1 Tax=Dioscorea zingiberensis TaxID=325984 RepID=A0A9D5C3Y2_9LILI|nr:hypothetical protein J5N97_026777 [Dioscorea zingiberensis]
MASGFHEGGISYDFESEKFHTPALEVVPKFSLHNRTTAYRFVTLVDNPELCANSTKSMIDHLLGDSGAVEAVAAVKGT